MAEKMNVVYNDSLQQHAKFGRNSEERNNNSSLPNTHQEKRVRRSSFKNHDNKITFTEDEETLCDELKTNHISQKENNNHFTSLICQSNSIVLQKTTDVSSPTDNDTVNGVTLHTVDGPDDDFETQKTKENLHTIEHVPDDSPQPKPTRESCHVVRNKQDVVLQNDQSFLSLESARKQNKERKCSALRTGFEANDSQSNRHELKTNSTSCALSKEVCTDPQIKEGAILFSETYVNGNSFDEKQSQESSHVATIKDSENRRNIIPDFIQTLLDGSQVCGDSYVDFSKPTWFDEEKYRRGQRFINDHLFGIVFADVISLLLLFAAQSGLKVLIYTRQSDTPYKAFRRYLSTYVRVSSWYEGDIWDVNSEAHKNLKNVRAMHETTRKRMASSSKEEIDKKVTLDDGRGRGMCTDLYEEIRDDFRNSCPYSNLMTPDPNDVYISQSAMSATQFGFFGMILVYPKMFGVHNACNADLEGLIHFWRTIAHQLGTEDRYNLCNGDLATVRQRCVDMIEILGKPNFNRLSRDWIHMSRVMFQGISISFSGMSFEVALLYLCKILNIKAPKLAAALNLFQWLVYLMLHVVFGFLLRFANVQVLFNRLLRRSLKKTLNMSPETLQKLKNKVYPYEISSDTMKARS